MESGSAQMDEETRCEGLFAIDVTSGTPIWSSPMPASAGVAVAGGLPYMATADGRFVGFGG